MCDSDDKGNIFWRRINRPHKHLAAIINFFHVELARLSVKTMEI